GGKDEFLLNLVGGLLDNQRSCRVAILHDEHAVESQGIGGVNLAAFGGVVVPDDLFVGSDLAGAELARKNNVAVRQHGAVTDLAGAIVGVRPDHVAIADEVHDLLLEPAPLPLAAVEEGVLCEGAPRERRLRLSLSGCTSRED